MSNQCKIFVAQSHAVRPINGICDVKLRLYGNNAKPTSKLKHLALVMDFS